MSSLVDSTYRALVGRLQRGGTATKPSARPSPGYYQWGFTVFTPGPKDGVFVTATVRILTRNVYKNDKVEIVVSDLVGTVPAHCFVPISGNCPSLDTVEAFIRTFLSQKQDLPAQPILTKPSPDEPEVIAEVAVEPHLPDPQPEPNSPALRRSKSRRGRRPDQGDEEAPVAHVEPQA